MCVCECAGVCVCVCVYPHHSCCSRRGCVWAARCHPGRWRKIQRSFLPVCVLHTTFQRWLKQGKQQDGSDHNCLDVSDSDWHQCRLLRGKFLNRKESKTLQGWTSKCTMLWWYDWSFRDINVVTVSDEGFVVLGVLVWTAVTHSCGRSLRCIRYQSSHSWKSSTFENIHHHAHSNWANTCSKHTSILCEILYQNVPQITSISKDHP